MTEQAITLDTLSKAAEDLGAKRRALVLAAAEMETEVSAVRKRHMPTLRTLAQKVAAATDSLRSLVATVPALFAKPRSRKVADIQFGFRKGSGKIEWDDEDKVIARIRSKRPDLVATAIVSKESVSKEVIEQLTAAELKVLGIVIANTGDFAFVKAKDADTDALIKLALGEDG